MATFKRILLVDDDDLARHCLREVLEAAGPYGLTEATDGAEALSELARARTDVVLLDLLMPNRSGLEVLAQIRVSEHAPRVLVISSLDSPAMVDSVMRAGACGFIGKPFLPSEIVDAVERALQG